MIVVERTNEETKERSTTNGIDRVEHLGTTDPEAIRRGAI